MSFTLADFEHLSIPPEDRLTESERYIHAIKNEAGGVIYISCVSESNALKYLQAFIGGALRKDAEGAAKGGYAAVISELKSGKRLTAECLRIVPEKTRVGDLAALVANWIVTARGGGHPIANSAEDETLKGQVKRINRGEAYSRALVKRHAKNREA